MQLSELKLVSASNIIKLRTEAGMTQAELGARLNYSDKTISKWERGEAIPDAFVLTQLAELFGVTTDYLLSSHDAWEPPREDKGTEEKYRGEVIIAIAVIGVWTLALAVFAALWLMGTLSFKVFAAALPVSMLVLLVLMCVFHERKYLQFAIAGFVLSIFVLLYFMLPLEKPWQIFLPAAPAVAIAFLSCNIRRKPEK